jgi:hypothetical protein
VTIPLDNVGLGGFSSRSHRCEIAEFCETYILLFSSNPSEAGISTDLLHFQ